MASIIRNQSTNGLEYVTRFLVLLVIVIAIVDTILLVLLPTIDQKITTDLSPRNTDNLQKIPTWQTVTTQVATISLPDNLTVREHIILEDPYEEKLVMVSASSGGVLKLALMAQKMDASALDELSGVTLRRSRPEIYQEEIIELNGLPALQFTQEGSSYEKVLFAKRADISITIAMTSKSFKGADMAEQVYGGIIDGFNWHI